MIKIKRCSKCKKEKGTANFSSHKTKKDGLQSQCKPCNAESRKESVERTQSKPCTACGHPERGIGQSTCVDCTNLRSAMYRYNLTEERARELRDQDHCDACGRTEDGIKGDARLHIDHCHDEGHVRGVLCHYCNVALGSLLDDPVRIRKLEMYINRVTYDEQNTLSSH